MPRSGTLLIVLGTLALGACTGSGYGDGDEGLPTNPPGGNPIINVVDFNFSPTTLSISTGTTVTFNWPVGSAGHTVIPSSANPSATPASPGGAATLRDGPYTFNALFSADGTYRFYCSEHGSEGAAGAVSGMSGTITVF